MTSQVMTGQALAVTPASLVKRLLATEADPAATIARATLAVVMFPHGAQKLLGWFGGYGFEGTMGFLTQQVGLPKALALGVILLEFFGPLLLLVGLCTRAVALGFVGLMIGAIASVHAPYGFFMNWGGQQAGEGFEYHLLAIALALVAALRGGGAWSLDRKLAASGLR